MLVRHVAIGYFVVPTYNATVSYAINHHASACIAIHISHTLKLCSYVANKIHQPTSKVGGYLAISMYVASYIVMVTTLFNHLATNNNAIVTIIPTRGSAHTILIILHTSQPLQLSIYI